jgi:hypothetical protein
VTTRLGERHVHGAGTAIMVRNFELAKGYPSRTDELLQGYRTDAEQLAIYESKEVPKTQRVAVLAGQGLHSRLVASALLDDPRSNHRFGYAVDIPDAGPSAPPAADVVFAGPAATLPEPVQEVEFEMFEIGAPIDAEARRFELEGMTAKALRPIASGYGVKGARVMAKPDMVDEILAAEGLTSK